MNLLITSLIVSVICAACAYFATVFLKKAISSGPDPEIGKQLEAINIETVALRDLLKFKDSYASKAQYQKIETLLQAANADFTKEKATLKEIESKLDNSQKLVSEKETQQQEIKSAKLEDENKLNELLTKHEELSNQAIALEQKLAQSMKNLDNLLNELELTQDQKAVLQDMSNSLTSAGARIRELLTEYNGVNERLQMLKQQHLDLEDEYTKLVEQQLGD